MGEDDCPELSYATEAKDLQLGRDLQATCDKGFRLPIIQCSSLSSQPPKSIFWGMTYKWKMKALEGVSFTAPGGLEKTAATDSVHPSFDTCTSPYFIHGHHVTRKRISDLVLEKARVVGDGVYKQMNRLNR